MKQNKTNYVDTYPDCVDCGQIVRHISGDVVSETAYEGLYGICNECLYDIKGVFQNEKPLSRTK